MWSYSIGHQTMRNFFHVDEVGRIMNVGTCAEADLDIQKFNDYLLVEGVADLFLDYYDLETNSLTRRPAFDFHVSQNPFRVENIPAGTLVKYPDGELIIDDGFLEWTAIEPGKYMFHFENFPYLSETVHAEISIV